MSPPASAARALPRKAPSRSNPARRPQTGGGRPAAGRRPPRRYSGPSRGISSIAAAAVAAPGIALPRRKPTVRRAPARRRQAHALRLLPALCSPQRLLSLSLRGRLWIGVLAFALIGIVSAQLIVLRLNTDIGRSLQRAAALQRENAALSIAISEAGSGERIEMLARNLGMVAITPGELRFLHAAGPSRAQAAAEALRTKGVSPSASALTSSPSEPATIGFVTPSSGETAITGGAASATGSAATSATGSAAATAATGAAASSTEGAAAPTEDASSTEGAAGASNEGASAATASTAGAAESGTGG
jgi:hypothetical protein